MSGRRVPEDARLVVPEVGDGAIHELPSEEQVICSSDRGVEGKQAIGETGVVLEERRCAPIAVTGGAPQRAIRLEQHSPNEARDPIGSREVVAALEGTPCYRERSEQQSVPRRELLLVARRSDPALAGGQQRRSGAIQQCRLRRGSCHVEDRTSLPVALGRDVPVTRHGIGLRSG